MHHKALETLEVLPRLVYYTTQLKSKLRLHC
ncbi:hypothetical protein NC651_004315 [Populus alba x Populus x berolinensis]|nr:hypothetical protein NC651_004315 [Populus alba x Populus x berolinensis]